MAEEPINNLENDRPRTLYLIDGHAQFFRAYYAIRSGMTSPVTSEPTNMTYGFVAMLLKLLREQQPDYLAVVIDVAGDRETFRSELYPEYKANRERAPEDFHPQVERCLQLLEQMHIPVFGEPGVEADDVIASLVRRLEREQPDLNIRILSRDKDLSQLIGAHVELFDPHKDECVTPETIFKVDGVQPKHVADILALMGDTVDNVPGVPGIGPKTASQLILQYGDLDNLFSNLDQIKGKRRENLEASRELVKLSRQLVALKEDMDVTLDLNEAVMDVSRFSFEQLTASFRELGFNRLADDLISPGGRDTKKHEKHAAKNDELFTESLFDTPSTTTETPSTNIDYELITTTEALDDLIKRIEKVELFAVDTETDHICPTRAGLCGISISLESGTGAYIPTKSPQSDQHLPTELVTDRLRPMLEDSKYIKVGHNLKFDLNVFRRHGIDLSPPLFDTMIASYVVDATRSSHKMDVLSLALLGHVCVPITDLIGKGKNQIRFDEVPLSQSAPYAAEDADITLRLYEVFAPLIETMGLVELFQNVEMPLVPVLADLEYNGIRLEPDELDRQRELLSVRIVALRNAILESAPHPFNPDSPKQLAKVLFNKPDSDPPGLGLKVLKRGKTGPSTDIEVLERIAADPDVQSPVPQFIVEYRQLTKLINTYLVALKEAINPETGRVHASFNQTVAATGRLSSSDPNLQNIPIRTDVGREIRRAFVAEPGNVLITADYSQIELRILAHLSQDPALIEAFESGADIHTAVAAEVYGVDPTDVTSQQRNSAKMVNFGIIYGITPRGLSRRLDSETTVEDARRIIEDYKSRFTGIDKFLDQCVQIAVIDGYVKTILGRRRAIPQVHARNPQQRALGERMAINSVVQGSAADLIKLAMIDLYQRLPDEFPDVRMLLQIHDELVLEAPTDQAEAVAGFVVQRMEAAMDLRVPLVVESAWSGNWIDAK